MRQGSARPLFRPLESQAGSGAEMTVTLQRPAGLPRLDPSAPLPFPPPPHDPRERELALVAEGWEVRLFGGRMFEYFVTRGFWHLQLWHPQSRVSVLTPSRLTCGFYEAYPVAQWKAQAADYDKLVALLEGAGHPTLPSKSRVLSLERSLVDDVVRAKSARLS